MNQKGVKHQLHPFFYGRISCPCVLRADPDDCDTLVKMNSPDNPPAAEKRQVYAYIRNRQLQEALQLLSRLCDQDETDTESRCLLATVHGMLGENEAAEHAARSALDQDSELPDAWSILGVALMAQENYPAALDAFRNAVKRNDADVRAQYNLGKILAYQGEYVEAFPHFQRAVELRPGHPEFHLDLGIACYHAGDFSQSIATLAGAARQFPQSPELHYWHARALQAAGERSEQAVESYETAIKLQPGMTSARAWLASLHQQTGDTAAALAHYEKALDLTPGTAEIHYNYATLLQAEDNHGAAEEHYRKALALNAGLIEAWNNLGLTLQEQGRLNDAMTCFDRVIEMTPAEDGQMNRTLGEVHWHRALLLLLLGDFERGWPEYEWRRADPAAVSRSFSQPLWDGSSLAGKTILVHAEQGIGDEIMFASCLPDLASSAGHVILECEPRLAPLFERSFPEVRVYPGLVDEMPQADVQLAIGSLPMYLRPSPEHFPGVRSYLVPGADALEKWKQRYRSLGEGLKTGISWRGGRVSQSRKRSVSPGHWEGLFRHESVDFINLQYGDCETVIEEVHRSYGVRIHDWDDADPLLDLDDFAAQVAALDLVISVDNATVHFAAALGIPVWILQPFAPEWRWLAEGEGSYWYPGVRQFRQPSPGDWHAVFSRVETELEKLLTS